MPRIGSDSGFVAANTGGLFDDDGNAIVSSDTSFSASPLGIAARSQALYGIANANFNLTPLEPTSPIIDNSNPLPYWSVNDLSDGVITATSVFDATTQTYGVQIDPGTAASGASFTLTTRSYLLTDDNLALRQKAQAVISKTGTAAVSTQWNLTLDAIYYDANNSALSTAVIGTALDTGTWTSLAGTTTPGGSAINAAAQYVDLTFTLTTTAAVTGTAKATIKSLLLTTSVPGGGGSQSFLVTETFTSSTTWTRPTGVDYLVAVLGIGAGGGGGGGGIRTKGTTSEGVSGAGGGGAGAYYIARDLYIGDQSSISIGVGAGGAGGTAITFSKAAAAATTTQTVGPAGSNGGDSTFGSYFTVKAGSGGGGGGISPSSNGGTGGARGGNATSIIYGGTNVLGGVGGDGVKPGVTAPSPGGGGFSAFAVIPYQAPAEASGAAGGIGTATGGSVFYGTAVAAGSAGWIGGGGGGGGVDGTTTPTFTAGAASNNGGGSGATPLWIRIYATSTVTGTAGNGGNAGANVGAGGGGGSGVALSASGTAVYNPSTITLNSGAGGNGSDGLIAVVYVG